MPLRDGMWEPDEDDLPEEEREELREDEYPDARWTRGDAEQSTEECPHCHEQIHEDAQRCPKCGEYVVTGSGASRPPFWIALAALLALGGLIFWAVVVCLRH